MVRDRALRGLYGRYVFGDYCRGRIESARLQPGPRDRSVRSTRLRVDSLSSFGEDARGRVYAVSLDGPVYRLAAALRDALDHGVARLRADNPSPYTLDGTNTWVVGRDPAWVVDPGPALDAHLDAIAAEVRARGGAGGIALTHDHEDHVEGVPALRERLGGPPVAAARFPGRRRARATATRSARCRRSRSPATPTTTSRSWPAASAFTGDAVLGRGQRVRRRAACASTSRRWSGCARSDLACCAPGHGPPVDDPRRQARASTSTTARSASASCSPRWRRACAREDELLDAAWADAPPAAAPGGRRDARARTWASCATRAAC